MSSSRPTRYPRSPAHRRATVRQIGWLATVGMLMGACIGLARGMALGREYLVASVFKGVVLGALIAPGAGGLEQIVLHRLWRRLSLVSAVLLRATLYSSLTVGVYLAVSAAFSPWMPWGLQRSMILPVLGITFLSLLVGNAVFALVRLFGPRVLGNLLSGRYRRPFEEERIFLFLDLVGSTVIAEHIGHLRYHAFLRDFIEDLEDPLLEYGGDVYQYIGDEVVVTWPIADAPSNARSLGCHFAFVDAIERGRSRYEQAYGLVPSFRTGIHSGRVVAGEIGQRRKQIVFVGDVVNTASRAQAEAKAREMGLVVTDALLARVELPPSLTARPLGAVHLKGKAGAIELFEVVRRPAQ
jgi:adenylate cyclase